LIVSPKLSEINREKVTNAERRMAQSYPPIAKSLIISGWVLQYPPPSEADLRFLAKTFELTPDERDFVLPATAPVPPSKSPPGSRGSPTSQGRAPNFGERLAGILSELGFPVRPGDRMEGDIIEAVGVICQVVKKIEGLPAEDAAQ
jgi:hypothetical protein